jgi:hypothetical protein
MFPDCTSPPAGPQTAAKPKQWGFDGEKLVYLEKDMPDKEEN